MTHVSKTIEYSLEASEFNWEVSPGKVIKAWGYNQQVPGPVLKAEKGDTMIIHFKNNLPEATVIHWHGIRLPSSMDGTDDVQVPVKPGESFEYKFIVPDAGTFWYHSHQNETVQMERGLYGSMVIADEKDPMVDNDRVLVFDDMSLDKKNDYKKLNSIGRWIERHDGREGSTNLINGKEGSTLKMFAGQTERWRLINASSARYLVFHLEGIPFKIISTDGGLIESPQTVTEVLMTPGERYDILVGPFNEWENFSIQSLPYDRMTVLKSKKQHYANVLVLNREESVADVPETLRQIEALAPQEALVNRKVKLSVGPSVKHGIDFLVNNQMHMMDEPVMVGALQIWEVSNTSRMDHPFHLHGFFFQVLEENGKAPEYKAWKDTINLKPKSKIKIAWMPDNRTGSWMYHCHILEHHEAGMMAHFDIVEPGHQPATSTHKHKHMHA